MLRAAIGVILALLVVVGVLVKLLLDSHEARGSLASDLETAIEANRDQDDAIDRLEAERDELGDRWAAEVARSQAFTRAVIVGRRELEKANETRRIELAALRDRLTPAQRDCADERVPAAYFDRLCHRAGNCDADRVRREAGGGACTGPRGTVGALPYYSVAGPWCLVARDLGDHGGEALPATIVQRAFFADTRLAE